MYVLTVKAATAEKGEAEREPSWSVISASVLGVSTSVSVPLGRLVCVPGAGDEGRGDLLEDLGLDLAPLRVGVPRGLLDLPETCWTVHLKERLLAMRRGAWWGMSELEGRRGRYLTTISLAYFGCQTKAYAYLSGLLSGSTPSRPTDPRGPTVASHPPQKNVPVEKNRAPRAPIGTTEESSTGGRLQPRPPCKGVAGHLQGATARKGRPPAGAIGCGQPTGATANSAPARDGRRRLARKMLPMTHPQGAVWHSEEWPTLCAIGTTRTSKRKRMRSTQRLGWWSSSYGSTLATKLDGAQGKVGRLVIDKTVQSVRCCVMTERVMQSSQRLGELLTQRIQNSCKGLYTDDRVFMVILSMLLDPEGVTQEWVDEGELPREQTKNRRWRRPNDVLAEATRGEVVV
ncbi:hypothetical protein GW17_00019942 [Ensete ventricosum]|nr:hypothetical protein GW17_00019942 [Ensete ventricosum]